MFTMSPEAVDIELSVSGLTGDSTEIVSGDAFDIKPIITNAGIGSALIFLELYVPKVGDTPIFTILRMNCPGHWSV